MDNETTETEEKHTTDKMIQLITEQISEEIFETMADGNRLRALLDAHEHFIKIRAIEKDTPYLADLWREMFNG